VWSTSIGVKYFGGASVVCKSVHLHPPFPVRRKICQSRINIVPIQAHLCCSRLEIYKLSAEISNGLLGTNTIDWTFGLRPTLSCYQYL